MRLLNISDEHTILWATKRQAHEMPNRLSKNPCKIFVPNIAKREGGNVKLSAKQVMMTLNGKLPTVWGLFHSRFHLTNVPFRLCADGVTSL